MAWFDFFKKKKQYDYDPTTMQVTDLDVGFLLDYDLSHWMVKEVLTYDWGDQCFSKTYRIENEQKTLFLCVETEAGLELSIYEKLPKGVLDTDIVSYYQEHQKLPNMVVCKGQTFRLQETCPGHMQSRTQKGDAENWQPVMCNDYESSTTSKLLSIEQWGDLEFEISRGKTIKEFEISNIVPSEDP